MLYLLVALLVVAPTNDDFLALFFEEIDESFCLTSDFTDHKYCDCSNVSTPSFYRMFSEGEMLCVKHPAKIFEDFCVCSTTFDDNDNVFYTDDDPWFLDDLSFFLFD